MTLFDALLDGVDDLCRQEEVQRRLQMSVLDPAAAYLARRLFKYTAGFAVLLLLQTSLLVVLLWTTLVKRL